MSGNVVNGNQIKLTSRTSVGTGGTISGIGQFLKSIKEDIKIVLADPEGSGLYNKVSLSVLYRSRRDLVVLPSSPPFGPLWFRTIPLIAGKWKSYGLDPISDSGVTSFSFLS